MSLINDALKQTKQAQPQSPPSPPPLVPVESDAQRGGTWLVPVVIILLLAAAGIFIGLSLSRHAPPAASAPSVAVTTTQPVETATAVPQEVTNAPFSSNMVVVPSKPPEPKLQGILFAATRPCAIVDGKTVFVGDHVGEFRVVAISKDSVTLQSETETNVLSLSPQ